MIHYEVRCSQGHAFDGWFKSSIVFEHQSATGLLTCPICGDSHVTRALMAPRLGRGATAIIEHEAARAPVETPAPAAPGHGSLMPAMTAGPAVPDQVRAVLQRLRAEVERRCDYVGDSFAEQARQMHDGAVPPRPIYGEATPEQAEALADDGIDIARIPWVSRADG